MQTSSSSSLAGSPPGTLATHSLSRMPPPPPPLAAAAQRTPNHFLTRAAANLDALTALHATFDATVLVGPGRYCSEPSQGGY